MRAIIQVVKQASVQVCDQEVGSINNGFLVLLAVKTGDSEAQARKMADKIANLRLFIDEQAKMNLSLLDRKHSVLLVSQFTLYGDCRKGNRPSFIESARPEDARPLFDLVADYLRAFGLTVATGSFGDYMQVNLINDGPTTIILEV